jgi:ankyrin repeat protein
MSEGNEKIDNPPPTEPIDNGTDAKMEIANATILPDGDAGPSLSKIIEDLNQFKSSQGDAELLRTWFSEYTCTEQSLNVTDSDGRTPLRVAAGRGLSAAVRKLIDGKAELNVQDVNKRTPLFEACLCGHEEVVKLLLDNGADTTLTDEDNKTPLYVAAENGYKVIAELILNKSEETLNSPSMKPYKWTPLHVAASDDYKEIISYLRDKGAKLDVRDEDEWTPLWTAVNWSEAGAMEALLEKKKEDEDLQLETEDSEGQTPLMKAAESGFWEGVRLLVEAGAKCDKSKAARKPDTGPSSAITPSK